MERPKELRERFERITSSTLQNWQPPAGPAAEQLPADSTLDMGWGRILFGHTFLSAEKLYADICREQRGKRDIAFYLRDPHVLLALGPDKLFLDPSHTYRLYMHDYRSDHRRCLSLSIRRISSREDAEAVNRIYAGRQMVMCDPDFLLAHHASRRRILLVAEDLSNRRIVGTVTGIDHVHTFNDPENGASLWCLAVDPQAEEPGIGEALVRHLIEHYLTRGRNYIDLSVMHDNQDAIGLYEKLGFQRVPVFCIKRKNKINEPLFCDTSEEDDLNPYARIITKEARKRGIEVSVLDKEQNFFALKFGGRCIVCRESLTELTSAIALCRCDDKRLTHRILRNAGLNVPGQIDASALDRPDQLFEQWPRLVVKPARGEQGNGVSVDIQSPRDLTDAITMAGQYCPDVLIEEWVGGEDLRIIVIDHQVVAAAVRRPPWITGTGEHNIQELIEKYNRRRAAATGGESRVPMDAETLRCLHAAGLDVTSIPDSGKKVRLRKAANLHTGGTIHDVTPKLHPDLREAARRASRAIDIPVTGLDFIVPDVSGPAYVIIEANERPGLANHEPQPTAARFVDLLFPQTVPAGARGM